MNIQLFCFYPSTYIPGMAEIQFPVCLHTPNSKIKPTPYLYLSCYKLVALKCCQHCSRHAHSCSTPHDLNPWPYQRLERQNQVKYTRLKYSISWHDQMYCWRWRHIIVILDLGFKCCRLYFIQQTHRISNHCTNASVWIVFTCARRN